MTRLISVLVSSLLLGAATGATAQQFPSQPLTMIVPLAPGGSTDVVGRVVAEGMSAQLGQRVIVENVGGAGGTIGVTRVVRATPDGYTFQIGQWGTNVATGAIYQLPFDLLKDLAPIGLIATQPFMVVARKSLPVNSMKELVDWLKANPGKASQGHAGIGSPGHVSGIFLQRAMGAQWAMVAYRSAGQAMQDILSGSIDIALDTPATSMPQIRQGTIKAFAVTATSRIAAAPEIPTVHESGVPNYNFYFWHGLWAPQATPKAAIATLNAALVKTLNDPAIRARLVGMTQDIFPNPQLTPEALASYQKGEIEKWWPVIKAAGIKPQ